MRILYSHVGVKGKDGWGRSFMMAKSLVEIGHQVVFLTNRKDFSCFRIEKEILKGVHVLAFPDILPLRLKSTGFGLISLIYKIIFSLSGKFDLVISDSGHRPSGLPCIINRLIYKSVYFSEWWDFFGKGGYYDKKGVLFKLLYGKIECWSELYNKKIADGVIVLSNSMKERAYEYGIENVKIIPGGALVDELKIPATTKTNYNTINIGYIGMDIAELKTLNPFISAINDDKLRKHIKFHTFGKYLPEDVIKQNKLEDIIIEHGWLDYLTSVEELNIIDLFVLIKEDSKTSRAGWPNKLGDFLACGRPVLITPYGDLIEFVKQNSEGFITTTYDMSAIYSCLQDILNNKFDFIYMGQRNRCLAESISWRKRAEDIVSFYQKTKKI